MNVKLLTEHHLEFLSLKGGCTGSPDSTLVKMPHCWKSHVTVHMFIFFLSPGIMTMVPMSVFQGVQAVQAITSGATIQAIPSNLSVQDLNQNIQIAMAPILNNSLEGVVVDPTTESSDQQQQMNVNDTTQVVEVPSAVPKSEETIETIESIVS